VAIADQDLASGGEAWRVGGGRWAAAGLCATPMSAAATLGVALRRYVALDAEVFDCRITTLACLAFLAGAVASTY
jgi:hypothetical protein